MSFETYEKDPGARLDYGQDWTKWLAKSGGDTITDHVVTVPEGLSKEASGVIDGRFVTVWISGGQPGVKYDVTFRVTTAQNRIDERTITIKVKQR